MSTSLFKKPTQKIIRTSTGIANPAGEIARQAGLSSSNTARQLGDITGVIGERSQDAYNQGGLGAVVDLAKRGDLTDPAGIFHPLNDPASPDAPPSITDAAPGSAAAISARDRIRRAAYRAQGRGSTIKVGGLAQSYSGQQKTLLGS